VVTAPGLVIGARDVAVHLEQAERLRRREAALAREPALGVEHHRERVAREAAAGVPRRVRAHRGVPRVRRGEREDGEEEVLRHAAAAERLVERGPVDDEPLRVAVGEEHWRRHVLSSALSRSGRGRGRVRYLRLMSSRAITGCVVDVRLDGAATCQPASGRRTPSGDPIVGGERSEVPDRVRFLPAAAGGDVGGAEEVGGSDPRGSVGDSGDVLGAPDDPRAASRPWGCPNGAGTGSPAASV
jgi:hypothetical protein